jgi:hypothetical protein
MAPKHNRSSATILTRAALLLCAGVVLVTVSMGSGAAVEKTPVLGASESIVLDPVVFGSSAGKSGLKAAPTTWSSRSNVRWNARWDANGKYLV